MGLFGKGESVEIRKDKFITCVQRGAKGLGVAPPKLNFWKKECSKYKSDEVAHCHPEEQIICVIESRLLTTDPGKYSEIANKEVIHLVVGEHTREEKKGSVLQMLQKRVEKPKEGEKKGAQEKAKMEGRNEGEAEGADDGGAESKKKLRPSKGSMKDSLKKSEEKPDSVETRPDDEEAPEQVTIPKNEYPEENRTGELPRLSFIKFIYLHSSQGVFLFLFFSVAIIAAVGFSVFDASAALAFDCKGDIQCFSSRVSACSQASLDFAPGRHEIGSINSYGVTSIFYANGNTFAVIRNKSEDTSCKVEFRNITAEITEGNAKTLVQKWGRALCTYALDKGGSLRKCIPVP